MWRRDKVEGDGLTVVTNLHGYWCSLMSNASTRDFSSIDYLGNSWLRLGYDWNVVGVGKLGVDETRTRT